MRKIILLMFIITSIVCFCSCSNNDKEPTKSNPMVGTLWAANSYTGEHVYVYEFYSTTEFQYYMTDKYGNITNTGVSYGSYTYKNGNITFVNYDSSDSPKSAIVRSNIMTITFLNNGFTRDYIKK